jgi:hypothetical protein
MARNLTADNDSLMPSGRPLWKANCLSTEALDAARESLGVVGGHDLVHRVTLVQSKPCLRRSERRRTFRYDM